METWKKHIYAITIIHLARLKNNMKEQQLAIVYKSQ